MGCPPDLLAIAARVGLASFLAAGFAAGSMLTVGTMSKLLLTEANITFLVWVIALVSCVTRRGT